MQIEQYYNHIFVKIMEKFIQIQNNIKMYQTGTIIIDQYFMNLNQEVKEKKKKQLFMLSSWVTKLAAWPNGQSV